MRSKDRAADRGGLASESSVCRPTRRKAELLAVVARLNADPAVDGILVQLPLPPQIDPQRSSRRSTRRRTWTAFIRSMSAASPAACPASCPARRAGCMKLLDARRRCSSSGARAVVLGRSAHRRQADGRLAAGGQRHRHHRAFAHARPGRRVPPAPTSLVAAVGRPRDGAGRLDQARRGGDRRRHQPPARRQARAATSRSTRRARSPARSRRCPAASGR